MQIDLFGIFRPVVSADIDSLSDPSFRDWAIKRHNEGVLNILLQDLVKAGISADTHRALEFLSSCSKANGPRKRSIITLIDLGIRPDKRMRLLLGASSFSSVEGLAFHKHLGSLSHSLISHFCKRQKTGYLSLNLQQPLFEYTYSEEEQMKLWPHGKNTEKDDYCRSLKDLWTEAVEAIRKSDIFFESYCCSIKYMLPLLNLLQVVAGITIRPVFKDMEVFEKWLWINALLTWSNMFFSVKEGRLPLPEIFEVQAFNRGLGLSGGRIDGIEIISENPLAHKSVGSYQVQSIGKLADFLRKTKRSIASLKIVEWKFAIGDNRHFKQPILPVDVAESPFLDHKRQIERYITLGSLDEYFARGDGFCEGNSFWERKTFVNHGCVIYLFPTSNPVVHGITLTPEGKKLVFSRDISSRWEDANLYAISRGIDRRYKSLFAKSTSSQPKGDSDQQGENVGSYLLPCISCELMPIVKVINQHKIFLDKDNIIENRNGKYILHLDRLVACIRSGVVKASSTFGFPRGGLVCCPVHEDRTPSLSVRPQDGYFYCFARSCKISGRLSLNSLPQEIRTEIKPELWVRRKDLFKDLSVLDEHHKILEQTQLLLQNQFCDSEGERYVREERGLDPDLAYEMGAGFGNSNIISALLDQGILLEELKRVGLIRFSPKVSSRKGLYQMLCRRGLKLPEIKREVGKTSDAKPIYGLPYFVLEGRATFPLKIRAKYANIYGRSVYPDAKVPHVKLSTEDSGVRHGAFNEGILYSDKCKEIVVTEGVFDAISVKQMFLCDALAIIGTKNDLVVELLAQSGKDVAIALDNDPAGRADTERLKKLFLRSYKFKGRVRDFTQSFIKGLYGYELEVRCSGRAFASPELASATQRRVDWRDLLDWDDWNTLLIKHGKWLS